MSDGEETKPGARYPLKKYLEQTVSQWVIDLFDFEGLTCLGLMDFELRLDQRHRKLADCRECDLL
jgi:hypothetical protein